MVFLVLVVSGDFETFSGHFGLPQYSYRQIQWTLRVN